MRETLFEMPERSRRIDYATEYKVIALREMMLPEQMAVGDCPDKLAEYFRQFVMTEKGYNAEVENLVVVMLTTRRKIKGHVVVSQGILDTLLAHPREIFRAAIVASAAAIVVMHNHPSGECEPSEADVKVTRDLIKGGQLLKIDVLDHVIIGANKHCSLRELGYFYA
jgi:DNA repair protein RadC